MAIKSMQLAMMIYAIITLFVVTIIFYNGDPIMGDITDSFRSSMDPDGNHQRTYDITLRNWRLTVPAFLFIIVLMLYMSAKGPRQQQMY